MKFINELERNIYIELSKIIKAETGTDLEIININLCRIPIKSYSYDYSNEVVVEASINGNAQIISGEYGKYIYRKYQQLKDKYLKENYMRALFVNPEKYVSIAEWYEGLDAVQKHRKMCGIFDSPYKFSDAFDKSKYGPKYTMFYFDEDVSPVAVINYIKMFMNLYGESDTRYIVEYKLRNIDGNKLMQTNTFNNFTNLKISSELFDNILKERFKPFTCKSLL